MKYIIYILLFDFFVYTSNCQDLEVDKEENINIDWILDSINLYKNKAFYRINVDSIQQFLFKDSIKSISEYINGNWQYIGIIDANNFLLESKEIGENKIEKLTFNIENKFYNKSEYDTLHKIEYEYTDQPLCEIIFYNNSFGLKLYGHFGGEWFIPIIKINDRTLILKENDCYRKYIKFNVN